MTLRYRISIRRHVSPGSCFCSLRGAGPARAEPFRAAAERTRRGAVSIRFNQRYMMYIDVYEWRYPFSIIIIHYPIEKTGAATPLGEKNP